jgi:hypothetical protein
MPLLMADFEWQVKQALVKENDQSDHNERVNWVHWNR